MNKNGFESYFKKVITNFDETKIWFEHKLHEKSNICFVLNGKLVKLSLYKNKDSIDLWKNYFIEFLETGNFDMNGYYRLYNTDSKGQNKFYISDILTFPLGDDHDKVFGTYSKKSFDYLNQYRKEHGDCGMEQVEKPI
jgi:hypothetical protein